MTYLQGLLALMLEGYGSWTVESREHERGAEPDECYCVARTAENDDDRPDLAIEVVWTSGGIDKLEVHRKLGVADGGARYARVRTFV